MQCAVIRSWLVCRYCVPLSCWRICKLSLKCFRISFTVTQGPLDVRHSVDIECDYEHRVFFVLILHCSNAVGSHAGGKFG